MTNADVSKKLEERKAALTKEFDQLKTTRESMIEEGKELQRKLNELEARLKHLQGAYSEVDSLLKGDEKVEPKKVPKEGKKK